MKNNMPAVRDHLIAQMERLRDESLPPETLKMEIERARSLNELGKTLVASAVAETNHIRVITNGPENISCSGFIQLPRG